MPHWHRASDPAIRLLIHAVLREPHRFAPHVARALDRTDTATAHRIVAAFTEHFRTLFRWLEDSLNPP
ncbi:hypothetical protein [Saccharothrix xinjiangensis]|uniref:Uncharacterized protein n=1 Tax=Saccharothrix xinjiangensis TaxID=204798 RepID=A0ABV9XYL8_9PSEU